MVSAGKVTERVKKIACEHLSIEEEQFDDELDLKEDYGFDSLDLFAVINQVENEFSIELETDEIIELNTFSKLIDYIESKSREGVASPLK